MTLTVFHKIIITRAQTRSVHIINVINSADSYYRYHYRYCESPPLDQTTHLRFYFPFVIISYFCRFMCVQSDTLTVHNIHWGLESDELLLSIGAQTILARYLLKFTRHGRCIHHLSSITIAICVFFIDLHTLLLPDKRQTRYVCCTITCFCQAF